MFGAIPVLGHSDTSICVVFQLLQIWDTVYDNLGFFLKIFVNYIIHAYHSSDYMYVYTVSVHFSFCLLDIIYFLLAVSLSILIRRHHGRLPEELQIHRQKWFLDHLQF